MTDFGNFPLNGRGAVPTDTDAEFYSMDDVFKHLGFGGTQWLMFTFVGIAWAGDGMEMMLLSYLGPEVRCKWGLSAAQESWITSVVFIGMMFGSYVWGALSDGKGRKVGFFATAIFTAVFGLLSAVAPNYGSLLLFRGLVGFGLGGVHVAYTLFLEFIPSNHRGVWLSFIEFFWTLGSIFQAGLAWAVLPTDLGWRGLVLLSALPLTVLIMLYPFIRESPHWLLANGREADAERVLAWVARLNRRSLPPGKLRPHARRAASAALPDAIIDDEAAVAGSGVPPPSRLAGAARTMRQAFDSLGSSLASMLRPPLRVTTLMLNAIWLMVALSYYGLILLAVNLHAPAGDTCDENDSAIISNSDFRDIFLTTTGEVLGLVLCITLVDVIGRRYSLAAALFGVAAFLTPLFRPSAANEIADFDVVFLIATRTLVFAAFVVLYIYTPEVYPTSIRSYAFGVSNAFCRIGGLVAPFVAVDMLERINAHAAEAVFFTACVIGGVLSLCLPIETKGRALSEDTAELELQPVRSATQGAARAAAPAKAVASSPASPRDAAASNPFHVDELGTQVNGLAGQPVPNVNSSMDMENVDLQ